MTPEQTMDRRQFLRLPVAFCGLALAGVPVPASAQSIEDRIAETKRLAGDDLTVVINAEIDGTVHLNQTGVVYNNLIRTNDGPGLIVHSVRGSTISDNEFSRGMA